MEPLNKIDRKQLYELVWTEAMVTLAPKLDISDVGLKKRCKKLGVPTPPRGYWAKLEAGKQVTKEPLPDTWTVPRKVKRLPATVEEAVKLPIPERDYSVEKPLPVVRTTKHALRRAKVGYYGLLEVGGGGVLLTKVAASGIDRAAWLWNELLPKLRPAGLNLVTGTSTISDGTETVSLELKEMTTRIKLPKRPDQERVIRSWLEPREPEWAPTGVLMFRTEEVHGASCARQWRESTLTRLDDRLDEVVAGLSALLVRKHELAIEAAERQKIRAEEARRREIEERRREHEQGRRRKLIRIADSFDGCRKVRQLCEALATSQAPGAAELVAWAGGIADLLDPVKNIEADLEAGHDPMEPSHEDKYPQAYRRW